MAPWTAKFHDGSSYYPEWIMINFDGPAYSSDPTMVMLCSFTRPLSAAMHKFPSPDKDVSGRFVSFLLDIYVNQRTMALFPCSLY